MKSNERLALLCWFVVGFVVFVVVFLFTVTFYQGNRIVPEFFTNKTKNVDLIVFFPDGQQCLSVNRCRKDVPTSSAFFVQGTLPI